MHFILAQNQRCHEHISNQQGLRNNVPRYNPRVVLAMAAFVSDCEDSLQYHQPLKCTFMISDHNVEPLAITRHLGIRHFPRPLAGLPSNLP